MLDKLKSIGKIFRSAQEDKASEKQLQEKFSSQLLNTVKEDSQSPQEWFTLFSSAFSYNLDNYYWAQRDGTIATFLKLVETTPKESFLAAQNKKTLSTILQQLDKAKPEKSDIHYADLGNLYIALERNEISEEKQIQILSKALDSYTSYGIDNSEERNIRDYFAQLLTRFPKLISIVESIISKNGIKLPKVQEIFLYSAIHAANTNHDPILSMHILEKYKGKLRDSSWSVIQPIFIAQLKAYGEIRSKSITNEDFGSIIKNNLLPISLSLQETILQDTLSLRKSGVLQQWLDKLDTSEEGAAIKKEIFSILPELWSVNTEKVQKQYNENLASLKRVLLEQKTAQHENLHTLHKEFAFVLNESLEGRMLAELISLIPLIVQSAENQGANNYVYYNYLIRAIEESAKQSIGIDTFISLLGYVKIHVEPKVYEKLKSILSYGMKNSLVIALTDFQKLDFSLQEVFWEVAFQQIAAKEGMGNKVLSAFKDFLRKLPADEQRKVTQKLLILLPEEIIT